MRELIFVAAFFLCACTTTNSNASQLISSSTPGRLIIETKVPTPTDAAHWWQLAPGSRWQIQFTGDQIDTALDVDVYDLDLFDTTAEMIADLHLREKHAICYVNVGAWEDWRPDAADFPAEVVGNDYEGWPGERWLDVSNIAALAPIMEARLDLCKEKGFDGVDPDNLDSYYQDTGFEITIEDQLAYLNWIADAAHERGLAIGLKNVPELAAQLEPVYDWALTESCFAQGWCEEMSIFIENGKPVFAIEYVEEGMTLDNFCERAAELGFSAILKNRALDGWIEFCL
jgi:hypothetical protein